MTDEELLIKKRLLELGNMSYQRGIPLFSDFLNLNQQNILSGCLSSMEYVKVILCGGYDLAERKMACFYPIDYDTFDTFFNPIVCLNIAALNKKFADKLTHRDVLGALMNLGIDRNVIGDILINDNDIFLFCHEKIVDFIKMELATIKHTAVIAKESEFNQDLCVRFEEINGTVASIRLDSVLSVATKLSRSKVIEYIEGAKVFVNGKLITTNSYNLKNDDVISVRGIGKFKYLGYGGISKKGKYCITLNKYV